MPSTTSSSRDVLRTVISILLAITSSLSTSVRFQRVAYLDNHIIHTPTDILPDSLVGEKHNANTTSQCAAACLVQPRCSSFFHLRNDQLCLLHSILFLEADEATPMSGVSYWQLSTDDCLSEQGFILYRPLGLCYRHYTQLIYWEDARRTCNNLGLQLVKVDSVDTFQHLFQFLRSSSVTRNQHVSIGAWEKNGTYYWQDGSDVTWFHWADNEPSHSDEQCVTMAWFFYFKWNDVPCSSSGDEAKYSLLCQKTI